MCAPGWGRAPGRQEGRVCRGACSPHEGQPLLNRSGAPQALAMARIRGRGQLPSGTTDPTRGQGPPPPRPGRLHWPTVGATVPFHRSGMLRPGIQDLPGPGQAQRCPPFWGAVLGPWRFWASCLLALQSWRHRDSCPWSGSARYWAQISDEGSRDHLSRPAPMQPARAPPGPGLCTSPTSPLWDPPGALRVRGWECIQSKPLSTTPGLPPPQLSRAGTLAPICR